MYIINEDDYERYLHDDAVVDKVTVHITSDFFPDRGFKHGLKILSITYRIDYNNTKEFSTFPDTLEILTITGNRQPLSLPDISYLDKLKTFMILNVYITAFPNLPTNLKKFMMADCIIPNYTNRQLLQPGFLPNKLNQLVLYNVSGLVALPLLPKSIVRLAFRGNGNLNSIYNNNALSGDVALPHDRAHDIIEQMNATTNKMKNKLNIGEIDDLLMVSSMRGNPHATYAVEVEKDLLKEYVGGKTKKTRMKRKYGTSTPTSRAHKRRTTRNRRKYHWH